LRRGFAGRGGADSETVLGGDPRVPSAESAEPVLPVFGRDGGYRLVVAEFVERRLVGLLPLLLENAEQVELFVFGRGGPFRV